ncbi:MAG: PD-(D/E)XK nuclease family protein [Rikenellaceae bacterium]|nr:PD-(D/E)XK nuclease family protein [Rikenellaceae bacterium]
MESFISEVVADLYRRYGTGISDVRVVLPGKRSRLFFDRQIASLVKDGPVWQPLYMSMDDITEAVTGLECPSRLRLITELFVVYSRYHKEPFDKFYFWGDMLLSDFDAVDNYMVDASRLFVNVTDIKEIEARIDYLSEEERLMVGRFWRSVISGASEQKSAFLEMWRTLYDIYVLFKARLREAGIGYRGMIYRDAAEHLKGGGALPEELASSRWAVVGFNALSEAERTVLDTLRREASEALFYWDADNYYLGEGRQEAGVFIRSNISSLGDDSSGFGRDNFSRSKTINIVSSPSDALQCRYVGAFLEECVADAAARGGKPGVETVVVLTDESLLLPVLYSVPESVGTLNVTGGYPLAGTAVHALCERLISLRANMKREGEKVLFYHKDVLSLLTHPYVSGRFDDEARGAVERLAEDIVSGSMAYVPSELPTSCGDGALSSVFSPDSVCAGITAYLSSVLEAVAGVADDPIGKETVFRALEAVYQVEESIGQCRELYGDRVEVGEAVELSLLRRHLSSVKISFEGEPLVGVQVMGILETRNLDFENVLILSVGEDGFPGGLSDRSYIPASLRTGYGMPSSGYKEAMYSYYFYRLLQRARRVDIVYNSSSDGMSTGEPSRFIRQLEIESPHASSINRVGISFNVGSRSTRGGVKPKDERTVRALDEFVSGRRSFSPSSLYRYIKCPYSFYLRYVEGVKAVDEVDEQMEDNVLGTVMHGALQAIYSDALSSPDFVAALRSAADGGIARYADDALGEVYKGSVAALSETVRMRMRFVEGYVKAILDYDLRVLERDPEAFRPAGFECDAAMSLRLDDGRRVSITGKIDRVDRLCDGRVRIIDYKSGKKNEERVADVAALFERPAKRYLLPPFQSMLYSVMLHETSAERVTPALYYARSMNDPSYRADVTIGGRTVCDISGYCDEYVAELKALVGEILDPAVPFSRFDDEESNACKNCDFRRLCY